MSTLTFLSKSEAETDALAAALAQALTPGAVVRLDGPLGAGKTRFVQGVVHALGVAGQFVNSPTFTLVQEYDAPVPIYHLDAYRLKDAEEFLELGGEEVLSGERAVFIEWAGKIDEALPRDVLQVTIEPASPTSRLIVLEAGGPRSEDFLGRVREGLRRF